MSYGRKTPRIRMHQVLAHPTPSRASCNSHSLLRYGMRHKPVICPRKQPTAHKRPGQHCCCLGSASSHPSLGRPPCHVCACDAIRRRPAPRNLVHALLQVAFLTRMRAGSFQQLASMCLLRQQAFLAAPSSSAPALLQAPPGPSCGSIRTVAMMLLEAEAGNGRGEAGTRLRAFWGYTTDFCRLSPGRC
jgi:hypothetical protein